MKCKICDTNITYKSVEEGKHIRITYNNKNYYFCCEEHCGQYMKELKVKEKWGKDRDEINDFVKSNIMLYKEEQQLPHSFFDRLADLGNGTIRYRENGRVVVKNMKKEGYPLQVILQTFKAQRDEILKAFRNKSFDNESQKLNYMWRIIEGNLNDEFEKWERSKRLESQMQTVVHDQEIVDKIYNNDKVVVKQDNRTDLSWALEGLDD